MADFVAEFTEPEVGLDQLDAVTVNNEDLTGVGGWIIREVGV